jgi:hypothetical protein
MEINRNQYFFVGLVLLLLGLQYQFVDTLVLKPECAKLLGEEQSPPVAAARDALGSLVQTSSSVSSRTMRPPEWIGWALLSLGAVLVLHSWAMPRPG